ncbi:hypothetical protein CDAR_527411 [Caerostris darwini]|uniref:Uncharacterized protein n=1 Tax=Caerostris darwini TaxID=1538125 RepID=A0AAV4WKU0_9ARAC|nr:hypothetical protein CDAR_527411 [Caerostris darwini]
MSPEMQEFETPPTFLVRPTGCSSITDFSQEVRSPPEQPSPLLFFCSFRFSVIAHPPAEKLAALHHLPSKFLRSAYWLSATLTVWIMAIRFLAVESPEP